MDTATLEQLLEAGKRILFGGPVWDALWRNLDRVGYAVGSPPPATPTAAPKPRTVRFMRQNYRTYEGPRGNADEWRSAFASVAAENTIVNEDCFTVLGLRSSATMAEVKSAYRAQVRVVHPDHGGSAVAFQRIVTAYKLCMEKF